jgi:hypothetical protein
MHAITHVCTGRDRYARARRDAAPVRTVASKNLGAHRPRNRKTAVLYSLSLAFIVFINTAYNVQVCAMCGACVV